MTKFIQANYVITDIKAGFKVPNADEFIGKTYQHFFSVENAGDGVLN